MYRCATLYRGTELSPLPRYQERHFVPWPGCRATFSTSPWAQLTSRIFVLAYRLIHTPRLTWFSRYPLGCIGAYDVADARDIERIFQSRKIYFPTCTYTFVWIYFVKHSKCNYKVNFDNVVLFINSANFIKILIKDNLSIFNLIFYILHEENLKLNMNDT